MGSSIGALAWPWWGRSLCKGNQWECWDTNAPYTPRSPQCPLMLPLPLLAPEYQHSLPAPNTPLTPPNATTPLTHSSSPQCPWCHLYPCWSLNTYTPCQPPNEPLTPLHPLMAPNTPTLATIPQCPLIPWYPCWFSNCHHFATDHLHEYVQFTIYHLEVSRGHLQCCEAQPISAISPKTYTLKLQLLCNTERPTKWSGHGKIIDPPRELLHMKDLLPKRVTIYLDHVTPNTIIWWRLLMDLPLRLQIITSNDIMVELVPFFVSIIDHNPHFCRYRIEIEIAQNRSICQLTFNLFRSPLNYMI